MNARILTAAVLLAALNAGVHAASPLPKAKAKAAPSAPRPRSLMLNTTHMPEGGIIVRGMTTMPSTYFVYGTRNSVAPSNLVDTVSGRRDIHPSYGVDRYGNRLPGGQIGPRFVPRHAAPAPPAKLHRKR